MDWVRDRKRIERMLADKDYFSRSVQEIESCIKTYQEFIAYWGEDSDLSVIKKTKLEVSRLEEVLQGNYLADDYDDNTHFSLTSHLNINPYPKKPAYARLRNILLMNYDEKREDALRRFVDEAESVEPPANRKERLELAMIMNGLGEALKKGYFGRELRRRNKAGLIVEAQNIISQYVN